MIAAAGHLFRLTRAGFVFAREGVLGLVDPAPLPGPARLGLKLARLFERPTHAGSTVKLSAALTRLGPTYVKLGQFLATRPDIVGPALARDLESLQDKMAPFPQAEAEAAVAAALGKPLRELFASFGPAVAAASIAQVHKAEADGHTLAVKVLRPGIERRFKSDLDTMYFAARNAERHSAEARRLRIIEVVDTLARSVTIEMDLRLEAAAIAEIRDNTKDDPDFRVPAIDWERTARTVLTLEWIDGTPLSNRAALEARGLDLPALGRALMQTFLRHALRDGFFHADMHPGNLFVDSEGRITAVDFGIMGRLSPRERRFLAEILYGFITRQLSPHRRGALRGRLRAAAPFGGKLRAGDPRHRRADPQQERLRNLDGEAPDHAVRGHRPVRHEDAPRAFDAAEDHGGGRRSRALVRSEPRHVGDRRAGGARNGSNGNLGPVGRLEDAAQGAGEVGKFFGDVPGLLGRAARITDQLDAATRDGLVLAPETVAAIGQAEARGSRWTRIALWVIAALLAVVIWKMV